MNIGSTNDHDRQLEAERAVRSADATPAEPEVALYREIFEVLGEPLPPALPEGFAARIAGIAETAELGAGEKTDRWLAFGLRACLAVVVAWSAVATLAPVAVSAARALPDEGALFGIQAIGVLALAALVDSVLRRHRRRAMQAD